MKKISGTTTTLMKKTFQDKKNIEKINQVTEFFVTTVLTGTSVTPVITVTTFTTVR
jgi:hypothetical protein